nr:MAG TPA: hypothetical protein [Caudoviricetes sp.]
MLGKTILNIDFLNFTHPIFTTSRYPNTHLPHSRLLDSPSLDHSLGFELNFQLAKK